MTQEIIKAEDFGINQKEGVELKKGLAVVLSERDLLLKEFESVSKLEVNAENIPKFKTLRLALAKNRTQGISKWHKVSKEYFLAGGKFVDAIKRKEIALNMHAESRLKEGELFLEKQEEERIAKLNTERIGLIGEFVEDASMMKLGYMEDDVFNAYLEAKKSLFFAAKKAAEEKAAAERKAAEERKDAEEKAIEVERIRVLKVEADLRAAKEEALRVAEITAKEIAAVEKKIAERRAAAKKAAEEMALAMAAIEKKAAAIREAAEIAAAKKEAIREAEVKAADEREATAKREINTLAKEIKKTADALKKSIKDAEVKAAAELAKEDREKSIDLVKDLRAIQTKYTFESKAYIEGYKRINEGIDKLLK